MPTICFYLKKTKVSQDRTSPLYLRLTNKKRSALLYIMNIRPDIWEGDHVRHDYIDAKELNYAIDEFFYTVKNALLKIGNHAKLAEYSVEQLKEFALTALNRGKQDVSSRRQDTFASMLEKFAGLKTGRTREMYLYTLKRMQDFEPNIRNFTFSMIDRTWLTNFNNYLATTSNSQNYRNIHLRNIRTVFNYALDEEKTSHYPFRRFRIKPVETPKRSLTVEQLRTLFDYPVEAYAKKYVDIFKLQFFLCGINIVDLCRLKDIRNGRVDFNRAKTHKLYSIRVNPEAEEIIDRYRGRNHLLDILDRDCDYRNFLHRMNTALQRIGEVERRGRGGKKYITPAFPGLSSYWARHTWATIAAEIDIPDTLITQGLGHASANSTTEIYIRRNQTKVDEANRRVLDFVLYGKDYRTTL